MSAEQGGPAVDNRAQLHFVDKKELARILCISEKQVQRQSYFPEEEDRIKQLKSGKAPSFERVRITERRYVFCLEAVYLELGYSSEEIVKLLAARSEEPSPVPATSVKLACQGPNGQIGQQKDRGQIHLPLKEKT